MRVYINYIDRELLGSYDLTDKDCESLEVTREEAEEEGLAYFIHKNQAYNLNSFMSIHMMLTDSKTNKTVEVDGIMNWSWSNGLAVKVSDTGESVRAYYFYSN